MVTVTNPPTLAASKAEEAPGRPAWLAIPTDEEMARWAPPEPDPGPCGCDAKRQGAVYTLHFDPPYKPAPDAPKYKWAGHYTGWAKDKDAHLDARLAQHEAGRGARITQVQRESGGTWRLPSVEPGDRNRERQLKAHSATRRCSICKAEAQAQPEADAELEAGA
jgi:hypothetical protein